MLRLELSGTPYMMGLQHADQVGHLRERIQGALQSFLAEATAEDPHVMEDVREFGEYLDEHATATWSMYRGSVDGLALDWDQMQAYALRTYLSESQKPEGCTVVADGRPGIGNDGPFLAKTRDYYREHEGIQLLGLVDPVGAHRYVFLGSAGSPGVFSSGMNIHGLAVADTHVPTTDIGVGLPRYALMLDLLERCRDVESGVAYLNSVTHLGGGNITLIDADGQIAVCESTHREVRIRHEPKGWSVSTNHFIDPVLGQSWAGTAEEAERTAQRRERVTRQLEETPIDSIGRAAELLSSHAGVASTCRHGQEPDGYQTIMGVVFRPTALSLDVAIGNPCRSEWETVSL